MGSQDGKVAETLYVMNKFASTKNSVRLTDRPELGVRTTVSNINSQDIKEYGAIMLGVPDFFEFKEQYFCFHVHFGNGNEPNCQDLGPSDEPSDEPSETPIAAEGPRGPGWWD